MVAWLRNLLLGLGLGPRPPEPQVGAIPYAVKDGAVAILLITSRGSGRWICPKGGIMDDLGPAASAAEEAWEEAGVRGVLGDPAGSYRGVKERNGLRRPLQVTMYPLRVEAQADDWPEKGERERRWVPASEAVRLVGDRGLARLVGQVAEAAARADQDPRTNVSAR